MEVKIAEDYPRFKKSVLGTMVTKDEFVEVEKSSTVDNLIDAGVLEAEETAKSQGMLDGYLNQNARTVISSLKEDDLSVKKLKQLKDIEESNKDRKTVKAEIDKQIE